MKASVPLLHKWFCLSLVFLMIASSVLTGCSSEKVLKIGYVTEQTGVDSYVAQASVPAMQDYIDEINNKGGIGGYKLQLISYDTRSEVTDAVTVAKRLIEQDGVVGIIGPSWSAAAIPVADIADEKQVVTVATTASNINVTVSEEGELNPYMFRVCFIDPYQGYALADFVYNKLNIRKVAFLIDVTQPYSVGIAKFFKDHFVELGGQVTSEEGYQYGDSEFRAQLAKIKNSGAEALFTPVSTYRDAGLIAQQMIPLGMKMTMVGADAMFVDDLLTMAGKELEGAYISTGVSTDAPEFAEFNDAFEKKHGVKANVYTYYGLDALMMIEYGLRKAIEKTGKPDKVAMKEAIETMQNVPLFTSVVTMEPDTHNPHNKPILIMNIKDSQWSIAQTFTPGD